MPWLLAGGWLLTILVAWLFHMQMTRDLVASHRQTTEDLRSEWRTREADWLLKEERLLNRCMTKSWQDYVQMQPQGSSSSEPGEGIGLSDETEAERWARAMGGMKGIGETVFEQDLSDLGLNE